MPSSGSHLAVEDLPPLQVDAPPVQQKLLICSSPRTISSTLCRYLHAAGLARPDEYFLNKNMGSFWRGKQRAPSPRLADYVDMLFAKCSRDGLFASKLHFHQFRDELTNPVGEELFKNATLVHLTRSDVRGQIASHISAALHDTWLDVATQRTDPVHQSEAERLMLPSFEFLQKEEAGWRAFFAYSGMRPLVVTDQMVVEDVHGVVRRIAAALDRPVDEDGLAKFHAEHPGRYKSQAEEKKRIGAWLDATMTPHAFSARSYRSLRMPRPWDGRLNHIKRKFIR